MRRMICSQVFGTAALCLSTPFSSAGTTVLNEDWEGGFIDGSRWHAFGIPAPYLDNGSATLGAYSFNGNGDANYQSGVAWRAPFSLEPGLRVEFSSLLNAYGEPPSTYWQNNEIMLVTGDPLSITDTNLGDHAFGPIITIIGETNREITRYGGTSVQTPTPPEYGVWTNYAFELLLNGAVEYWREGAIVATTAPGFVDYGAFTDVSLVVDGRSYQTTNLIDNIRVSIVPAPGALFALGGLGMIAGRRRRH